MKRIFCLILCALTALFCCACGDNNDTPTETVTEAVTEAATPDEATTATEAAESDARASLKAFMARFDDTPTVGDKLVYEDKDLTVTVHGINYAPISGPELHLTIENRCGKDIAVSAPYAAVNGYMITPELNIDVPHDKSANGNLTLPYFSLAIADITCIREIEFALRITEARTYNPLFTTDLISVKTSAKQEDTSPADDSGQTVYDEDGVKIILKGVSTDRAYSDGAEMMVCIFNDTDRNIAVRTDDITVNGYEMTSSVLNRTVLSGHRAADAVTFYKQELKEYGIDTIDSVKVAFEIKDADTWEVLDSTDMINVELKGPEPPTISTEASTEKPTE